MNNIKLCALLLWLSVGACSVPYNQFKNKQKHGKWHYKTSESSFTQGRYRNGEQIGIWKTFQDGKLYRKERFRATSSAVKFYHLNGSRMSKGRTESTLTKGLLHWYYSGTWNYYDEQGKIIERRKYHKGEPVETDTTRKQL